MAQRAFSSHAGQFKRNQSLFTSARSESIFGVVRSHQGEVGAPVSKGPDMSYSHNYAVSGLQEPEKMNVVSLEKRAAQGNTLLFDDTGNQYVVESCGEPSPTEFDAACLAIKGVITLRVAPITRRGTATAKKLAAVLPIDEWDSEACVVYEVIGRRQDDLPCYECGQYTDTLIVKTGYTTRDICHACAVKLGVTW